MKKHLRPLTWLVIFTLLTPNSLLAADAAGKKMDLSDLGFSKEQTAPNNQLKIDLDRRASMLKTHQVMGLVTGGLMLGTFLISEGAKNKDSWIHPVAGGVTGASYLTTAYFSIFAPKPDSIKDVGTVKWHKALAWLHAPLMALTVYAGMVARSQRDNGDARTGIAKYKGAIAIAEMATFFPALAIMVFDL